LGHVEGQVKGIKSQTQTNLSGSGWAGEKAKEKDGCTQAAKAISYGWHLSKAGSKQA
jgi:hypothetical protein